MSEATRAQQETTVVEPREETRSQLARHVGQQPVAIQTRHKWMLALEAVAAIVYIGLFVWAIYVSVAWKTYGELAVPRWWMASQVCAGLLVVVLGLHTLIVGAFLPVPYPSGKETIVTGQRAVRRGWMLIGLGPLWAAAWAGMVLGIVLSDAEPLAVFIPFVVSLSIGVGVLSGIWSAVQRLSKSR